MKQINKYILEHFENSKFSILEYFENSKFSILERLHITKNTGGDIDNNLSFDEFINYIYNKFKNPSKSYYMAFRSLFKKINKDVEKFKYRFVDEDKRNNWRYNVLFEYCEDLLKDPYPNEEYKRENNLDILEEFNKMKLYYHTNFALNDSEDEYYIFCIDFKNNSYEIYEVIN